MSKYNVFIVTSKYIILYFVFSIFLFLIFFSLPSFRLILGSPPCYSILVGFGFYTYYLGIYAIFWFFIPYLLFI